MTKNREKLLTLVALVAIALLAGDKLILTPLANSWKSRSARIAAVTMSINQGALLLDREDAIRDRWQEMQASSVSANSSLAEDEVRKAVQRWTERSRITFTSIKPQYRQSADDYGTIDCQVDANGDLQGLTRFIYELERDPLPLRVEQLDLTSRDATGRQLSLSVRFTALVLFGGNR
jgi:hypothetical protein